MVQNGTDGLTIVSFEATLAAAWHSWTQVGSLLLTSAPALARRRPGRTDLAAEREWVLRLRPRSVHRLPGCVRRCVDSEAGTAVQLQPRSFPRLRV